MIRRMMAGDLMMIEKAIGTRGSLDVDIGHGAEGFGYRGVCSAYTFEA